MHTVNKSVSNFISVIFVFLTAFGVPQSTRAAGPLCVDPTNTSTCFATIQEAVDAAVSGDVINVYPGTYSETASNRFLYDASGPYQFGIFVGQAKSGITIQGVDALGSPITNYANVLATVNTNATNNFGPSGFFIEGDDVTIAGIRIGVNTTGQNKTIEVISDNFTLKNSDIADFWGSVYLNDFRFDVLTTTSHVKGYRIEGNNFQTGVSLDIASGAGYSGPVSGRVISGNTFALGVGDNWPAISFSGSDTGVPWFVYSVGGAVIQGNTFVNLDPTGQFIRARGTYDNSQFDWASYWNDNTFNKAVIVGVDPANDVRTYSYPNSYGTFNNVRRIGAVIQGELDHAQSGDTVLVKAGTYAENLTILTPVTLKGAQYNLAVSGRTAASVNESTIQGLVTVDASNVVVDGFTLTNPSQTYALYVNNHTPSHSVISITHNIVDNVGSPSLASNVHAILLNQGPDSVTISNNRFNNIKANTRSASAIGVLDSVSTNSSEGLIIQNNTFTDIASTTKGAYGIILNNAAGVPDAQIKDNSFSGLSGGWTHAIGLEGPTLNAVVTGNVFDSLAAAAADNEAILFEKNSVGNTVTISHNQFNGTAFYGVAIHPNDLPGGLNGYNYTVTAEKNWWNDISGPGSVGTGAGALVGTNVDYTPWCKDATCTIFVPPFPLVVTANNQTINAGQPYPTFTFNYSGFLPGDTSAVIDVPPSCSVTGNPTLAGIYPIVCSGGSDAYYGFSYVNSTLTINAVNTPPTNISISNAAINENQPVGSVVGTFSTTDPDVGDTFTYAFCGGTDDASFQINGGNLQSAAVFDFEVKNSYSICVRSTDSGTLSTTKTLTISVNNVIDTATFADVPMTGFAWLQIETIYAAGITSGCTTSPLNYCPDSSVTRAQMAVFLLKGVHGSSYVPPAVNGNTGFTDVATDYWAAPWIKQLAAEGITSGCGDGNYCPDATVTRAQMSIFLLKAKNGSGFVPPAVGSSTGFADVATNYWAAPFIKQLVTDGITSGCGGGNYCPDSDVTRAQMAVFLVRTFNLP